MCDSATLTSSVSTPSRVKSRVEINFNRLIVRCEQMALDTENFLNPENWRLEKYVSSLETMLNEVHHAPNPPDNAQLQEYQARVDFLKGLLNTAKLPTLSEKVAAAELIKPVELTTTVVSSPGVSSPMEIKQRHKTKYSEDLRRELLGDPPPPGDTSETMNSSLNDLVKYHHSIQERIADHMLDLTRTLKEQVTIAGQVVKKDTEILESAGNMMDRNDESLRIETEKLAAYNKRACKCWIWLTLLMVSSVFIVMVLFMRLFKKKNY